MGWKCWICQDCISRTLNKLLVHIRKVHTESILTELRCGIVTCPLSFRNFGRFKSLYRHMQRHHGHLFDREQPPEEYCHPRPGQSAEQSHHSDTFMDIEYDATTNASPCNDGDDNVNENGNLSSSGEDPNASVAPRSMQENLGAFFLDMQETHKLTQDGLDSVMHQLESVVDHQLELTKVKVLERLQQNGIDIDMDECFEHNNFKDLDTNFKREKFIKQNFSYVEPVEVVIGRRIGNSKKHHRHGTAVLDDTFHYIPMIDSLKQLLESPTIQHLVGRDMEYGKDGYLLDLCDGQLFKNHPIFGNNDLALQIIMYCDDLEVCNPLGPTAGTHKLTFFYYVLGNFTSSYRSKNCIIRLYAAMNRKLVGDYGIDVVLEKMKNDIILLQNGFTVQLEGVERFVRGDLLAFCGDTLSSNEIGGFKEGVGLSFQKCRHCECTDENMHKFFSAEKFVKRTCRSYNAQCLAIENADGNAKQRLSIAYGINRRSVLSDVPHFNIIQMMPIDIMHIMLEGVCHYEIKLSLAHLINSGEFSLKEINDHISDFPYGYNDKSDLPKPIVSKDTLKQTASGMANLVRILPLILVNRLKCVNKYVKFVIDMCELVNIIYSHVIHMDTIHMLRILIKDHLTEFTQLFDNNVIPKQHYMLHIPDMILDYGPLAHVSVIRFEAKHQMYKKRMVQNKNFKNPVKTCVQTNQRFECLNNVYAQHPVLRKACDIGPMNGAIDLVEATECLINCLDTKENVLSCHSVRWIIMHGRTFKSERCYVTYGHNGVHPEFGLVKCIWICSVSNRKKQQHFLGLKMLQTLRFNRNVQAYEVAIVETQAEYNDNDALVFVDIKNIFVHYPLHMYSLGDKKFITTPYDVHDLLRMKIAD